MMRGFSMAGSRSGRVIAAALVAGLILSLAAAYALQRDAAAQQDRPAAPVMPEPFPRVMPPVGGMGLAMVVYGDHIYIAHGGTLYKVEPDTMRVVKELQFVKPPVMPMRPEGVLPRPEAPR